MIETILLERQEDGNWKGKATKDGVELEVREIGPEVALLKLLTHE